MPGTPGPITNVEEAIAFAEQYGTPIILKAAYGGGGRGMRRVDKIEDVSSSSASLFYLVFLKVRKTVHIRSFFS